MIRNRICSYWNGTAAAEELASSRFRPSLPTSLVTWTSATSLTSTLSVVFRILTLRRFLVSGPPSLALLGAVHRAFLTRSPLLPLFASNFDRPATMVRAALVHGTLVNAVSLQSAARVFARPPSTSATLARLYKLSRAELSSQYSPDSLIDGEWFGTWLERLRAVQAGQRKAAVGEERRLVRSIICAKCAPKYAAEPGPRSHELFPQENKEYGKSWKMLEWRQYRREEEMYEKCVRADEEGLPRPVDKYAGRQEVEEMNGHEDPAGHAGGVEETSASPRYPACACPRCVWQAREAIQVLNRDTNHWVRPRYRLSISVSCSPLLPRRNLKTLSRDTGFDSSRGGVGMVI